MVLSCREHVEADFLGLEGDADHGLQPFGLARGTTGAGVAGHIANTVDSDCILASRAVLGRFERDVLRQPGVTLAVVQVGLNDLGWADSVVDPGSCLPSYEALIDAYTWLIEAAHARGIRLLGMTLSPFEGAFAGTPFAAFHQPEKECLRQRLNRWIREESGFDAVLDIDALVRDPQHPGRLLGSYDSGDHLHPGAEGSKAIAQWLLEQPALKNLVTCSQ
nr:GDSL-type esterase/lipase family protein [Pseudomonas sp. Marseille-Q3773]